MMNERQKENCKFDKYLCSKDVKKMCGISDTTLWRWMKTGHLPYQKVGSNNRFLQSDVEKVMSGNDINYCITLLLDGEKHNVSEFSCSVNTLLSEIDSRNLTPHIEGGMIWVTYKE